MNTPAELKYTKTHEWVQELGGGKARVGLTDFAQDSLGGIVFVGLPEVGATASAGGSVGEVESVKLVSDVISPFTGTVSAVNEALNDDPGLINADPYGAWIYEVEGITASEELLDAAAYEKHASEG